LNKFSDLLLRAASALVGVIVMIFCIVFSHWTFFGLFLIILTLSIREYARMVVLPRLQIIWLNIIAIGVFSLLFLTLSGLMPSKYLYGLIPLASCGLFIQLYLTDDKPLRSMALLYLGIGYIILPISLLSAIAYHPGAYEPVLIIGLLGITWCMDTGAYFFGSAFGKNRLFERVSPKKSWEGAVGGFALALSGAWALSFYFDQMNTWQWLASGAIIAISGICGDLVESFIKRVGLTKDSGHSIPGHGGFLDRFDSLIYSIPFFLFFLKLL
jgi:phosphatidate cytidylyltransferase